MNLNELYQIIEDRKINPEINSYINSLMKRGNDRIIQKIGEEATEVVIAAKNKTRRRIISEVADLFFHMIILLSVFNIKPEDIYLEFERRKK